MGAVLFLLCALSGKAQEKVADSVVLDEALVVAYGVAGKYDLTGSAVALSGDRVWRDLPVHSFEEALTGSIAGLRISPVSSQPGSVWNLRLRGTGSMNASCEPLYVIDGVPVVSGNIAVSSIGGDTKAFNAMISLSPGDIEQVTVLKDASASALYGSRAANGVILITTRQGKSGETRFLFKADWGMGDWAVTGKQTLSGEQQHLLTYEAFYNEALLYNGKTEAEAEDYGRKYADKYAPLQENYSNWEKALFRSRSSRQHYRFSASGGKEGDRFYASIGYDKESGKARASSLDGFTGRLNLSRRLRETLQLTFRQALSKQRTEVVPENTREINPWYMLHYVYKPNYPIRNEDGSWFHGFPDMPSLTNLVEEQGLDKNRSEVFRSTTGLTLEYRPFPAWKIIQRLNYDFFLNESTLFWPPASSNGRPTSGVGVKIVQQMHQIYSSSLLTYRREFAERHRLEVLAGWEVDDRMKKYTQAKGTDYPGDRLPELENAAVAALVASGKTDDRLLSFLSRLNYDFGRRYYLSLSYRRDGSSRLGRHCRWGDFWSVGTAWRLSRESFLREVESINELKLRFSYGVTGTLPSTEYGHQGAVRYGVNYQDLPGLAPVGFANPGLSWERNESLNLGLEVLLWQRLGLTLEVYRRTTGDLLQDVPVSMTTGLQTALRNIGSMRNRGIEAQLSFRTGSEGRLEWQTTLTLAHNRNRIRKLYAHRDIIDGSRIWREGAPYTAFWSREWAGVDSQTGEEQWVLNTLLPDGSRDRSLTKDGNLAEKVVVGEADPRLTGGWANRLSWKGVELTALFSFSSGGKVMDDLWTYTDSDGYFAYTTIGAGQWDRWQKPGDKTRVPRRINGYKYGRHGSSRHLIPTDHLRLKNLMVSWTLPGKWVRKAGLFSLRVYMAGTNLWTWSRYDDLDPEQGVEGFTTFAFPQLKTCNFGVEIGI